MTSQEKITVYNLADLKNTSDDAIPNYLNSLKFRQTHQLTDVRLALGYSALAIAGACFLWDYKFGFENTKLYTAVAVVLYTILNSALTLWIWKVEKGVVYQGVAPSGETISISTSTIKNVPDYHVSVTIQPKDKTARPETISFKRSFAEWFDGAGHFVAAPFQSMLASSVPVVAKLDPKRVVGPTPVSQGYSAEMLDVLSAKDPSYSEVAASGTDVAVKKGGKRRTKA